MKLIKSAPRIVLGAAVTLAALGFATDAPGATATSSVAVTATVVVNCTISTSAPLAFGNYDPVSANASTAKDATGTLSVNCTTGSAAAISLDQGVNAATGSTAAAPLRRMLNGTTNYLSYDIYRDSARTLVWGGDATVDLDITGSGTATTYTMYGRIPSGQNKPAGAYSDTVVATVTF
jgi:spore coat protein U-like protein